MQVCNVSQLWLVFAVDDRHSLHGGNGRRTVAGLNAGHDERFIMIVVKRQDVDFIPGRGML